MSQSDLGIVHVDLERLDRLLNLVGELVITRRAFVDQSRRARSKFGFKEQVLKLIEDTERVGRITEEIQSRIIKARLVPVGTVFRRFENLVEELSKNSQKDIRLVIQGEKTEVDKRTIDELAEPLVHLVRNALDHGIETSEVRESQGKSGQGTITLDAHHSGNRLVVEIRDDGAGVDLEKVKEKAISRGLVSEAEAATLTKKAIIALIFEPGFSTRSTVTDLSGRGVGMDAAKESVEALGGSLEMLSVFGEGSSARIELPLTTAIVEALMVKIGDEVYALPLDAVQEIIRIPVSELSTVEGQEVLELRGTAVSVISLDTIIDLAEPILRGAVIQLVVVHHGSQLLALIVDEVLERHDIVIKAMGQRLASTRGIAGASIGGDGSVVIVLDVGPLCDDTIRGMSLV